MGAELKTAVATAALILAMGAATFARLPAQTAAASTTTPPPAQQRGFFGAPLNALAAHNRALVIPVAGVQVATLADTWGHARSGGRSHQGIDIMAPALTPVRAAAGGRVVKFFRSDRGGLTVYQMDESGKLIFYYAHLASYAPSLREGDVVRQGDVIAYVGSSGNASTPHLHFEIQRASTDGKWWHGEAFNPYPALIAGRVD